jgi:hypothetical protein
LKETNDKKREEFIEKQI